MIKSISKIKKERGFTIVELLVVIVVIGILAAITIVSYTGITAKANKAAAIQNSSSVMTAADAYFAENQLYPTTTAALSAGTVKVPSNISVILTPPVTGTPAAITYFATSAGYCIEYWDVATTGKIIFAQAGTSSGLCI